VYEFRFGFQTWQGVEHGLHDRAVAEQQIFDVRMAGERQIGARQYRRGAMIAPHGIERNADLIRHASLLVAFAPASQSPETDARPRP
jgi:hypothetical protein